MKMVTKIAVLASFATFMFAGVNLTWGNSYAEATAADVTAGDATTAGDLFAKSTFGVWFDVNDATSVGWENGLKVGLAGPAGMTMRLGYDGGTSLGVSRSWWSSTGAGWGTSLNTTVDFDLTGTTQGDFAIGVNLGFGF